MKEESYRAKALTLIIASRSSSQIMVTKTSFGGMKKVHLPPTGYTDPMKLILLPGDQNKQVQCDIEFLFAIMTDLDRLAVAWFDCSTAEDQKSWQLAFDPIVKEIQRLGENTCLIPDEKVRGNFFAYIETFCSFMQERPSTDLKSMLQQEHEKRSQDSRGGVYNTNRLPWHDFLHHYAPGLPMVLGTRRSAHENGTRQVIPVGGIRLLYEWGSDFDNYIDEINPVRNTRVSAKRY